jgi:3-oxoacyl-ACP reductase-like protein
MKSEKLHTENSTRRQVGMVGLGALASRDQTRTRRTNTALARKAAVAAAAVAAAAAAAATATAMAAAAAAVEESIDLALCERRERRVCGRSELLHACKDLGVEGDAAPVHQHNPSRHIVPAGPQKAQARLRSRVCQI